MVHLIRDHRLQSVDSNVLGFSIVSCSYCRSVIGTVLPTVEIDVSQFHVVSGTTCFLQVYISLVGKMGACQCEPCQPGQYFEPVWEPIFCATATLELHAKGFSLE